MREKLGTPVICLYMLALLLAAWPQAIRPSVFDRMHEAASSALWSVGILPGLPVFRGAIEKKEYVLGFRCVVATGTDASGKQTLIYPTDPCPTRGLRWRPETYRHMLFHWIWFIDEAPNPWNLWAMVDHFCHRLPDREFDLVTIRIVLGWRNYETGEDMILPRFVGQEKCR